MKRRIVRAKRTVHFVGGDVKKSESRLLLTFERRQVCAHCLQKECAQDRLSCENVVGINAGAPNLPAGPSGVRSMSNSALSRSHNANIAVEPNQITRHTASHGATANHRYAIDAHKLEKELGWRAQETFATVLRKTVQWYLNNMTWMDDVTSSSYQKWVHANYGHLCRSARCSQAFNAPEPAGFRVTASNR